VEVEEVSLVPPEVEAVLNDVLYRPVRWRSAFEDTVERLTQAIKLGVVRPGFPLPPERDLVSRLQVSRTTLREAIRAIQRDGYLETRRGRAGGTFVAERAPVITTDEDARRLVRSMGSALPEALDLRAAIEPKAAELAASRADPESVARLSSVLRLSHEAPAIESRRWDSTLHIAVAQAADSPLILDLVLQMQLQLHELLSFLQLPRLKAAARRSTSQHELLVDAISAGDPEQARAVMDEHIRTSHELLYSIVKAPPSAPAGSTRRARSH
jgi:DNA-binding FadR family transcriptional regulator